MMANASVMIMAVPLKSFFPLALALAIAACGGDKAERAPAPPPARPEAAVTPTDTRPVIAAFGDSLSAGFGLDPGQAYPDQLQRLLDAAGYRYRVVNLGVSGDTTTDGLERLSGVIALHPAMVILEFGGNDGLRGQPVGLLKQNLAKMIEALQSAGANVVLAGMTLPRNYGPEYIDAFERIYPELAQKYKVVRIPFFLEGVGGNATLTQNDGLHPTAQGAAIVAQNVIKYLRPLLRN